MPALNDAADVEPKRFVTIGHRYNQPVIETCTMWDHLEAVKVSERIVEAVRGSIIEDYWDFCSVELTQDRNVSKDPKWKPRTHVTLWAHFAGLDEASELEAKILLALRSVNFGFQEPVEERRAKDGA